MSELSDFLEENLLNYVFNGGSTGGNALVYVALYTATPTDTGGGGGTAVSGGAYARQAVYDSADTHTVKWAAAATTSTKYAVKNAATVTYPTATANWGDVKAFAIFDHLTTGNMLVFSPLDATKTVNANDTFKFTTGNLAVTLE
ncbi:MAG: hypothetical protein GY783_03405 [Gammaproteobacteria bacterium]|nr:hypothetical protein [Gammaproteobacteria bacterium]